MPFIIICSLCPPIRFLTSADLSTLAIENLKKNTNFREQQAAVQKQSALTWFSGTAFAVLAQFGITNDPGPA